MVLYLHAVAEATEVVRNEIGEDACRLVAVGVPSAADAPGEVEALIASGVELIEMCGAFGPAETEAVRVAAAGRVPIGAVTYPCSEAGGSTRSSDRQRQQALHGGLLPLPRQIQQMSWLLGVSAR